MGQSEHHDREVSTFTQVFFSCPGQVQVTGIGHPLPEAWPVLCAMSLELELDVDHLNAASLQALPRRLHRLASEHFRTIPSYLSPGMVEG